MEFLYESELRKTNKVEAIVWSDLRKNGKEMTNN